MSPGERRARVLLWVVPALWSSNYLIARASEGVIAPHVLALGRWMLAIALLLPFTWRVLASAEGREAVRREWRQLLVLGGLGMWICGALVYLGGHTTSSTNIALLYAATPVAIVYAGSRLLNEPMSRAQWGGVVLALAGVLFVIAGGDPRVLLEVRFTVGDGWILVAAVGWAAYSVLLKHWPSALPPLARLVAIASGGVVVLVPFTLLEAWVMPAPPLGAQAVMLVVLAALLPGVISYGAYSYLQRELGASRTALMMYLGPVYAALGAWWVLGEPPRWYHGVGAALILPSIWLATRGSAGVAQPKSPGALSGPSSSSA
jgi:drug/metabolite transporter (DMT)-like permease